MASLKVSLDRRRKQAGGTFSVIFRLTFNGTSRDIYTGIKIPAEDWLEKSRSVSKSNHNYVILNTKIKDLEQRYLTKVFEFERKHPDNHSINDLKDYITGKSKMIETVHDFWVEQIGLLYKANRNGGARVNLEALNAISKHRDLHIGFNSINYKFLQELEADFISCGVGINSVGVYFRALRAIYNRAINSGLADLNLYPFRRYKIRKAPTVPRALSLSEIRAYFSLNLPPDHNLYDTWLMGKLTFILMGINYADLIKLTRENMRHGRIYYTRSKTSKMYSIFLHPEAIKIINYFAGRDEHSLFGRISPEDLKGSKRLPNLIHQGNKIFNKYLEQIGDIIRCDEKLTGYVFRYTWANVARQLGYPVEMISAGLGHSHGNKVTLGYLNPFDFDKVDSMNIAIIEEVSKRED